MLVTVIPINPLNIYYQLAKTILNRYLGSLDPFNGKCKMVEHNTIYILII